MKTIKKYVEIAAMILIPAFVLLTAAGMIPIEYLWAFSELILFAYFYQVCSKKAPKNTEERI